MIPTQTVGLSSGLRLLHADVQQARIRGLDNFIGVLYLGPAGPKGRGYIGHLPLAVVEEHDA